jgi:hypothetical protein
LDLAGVTSYVRVLGFLPKAYHRFLHLFHSKGLDLDKLTACWVKLCLVLFKPVCAGTANALRAAIPEFFSSSLLHPKLKKIMDQYRRPDIHLDSEEIAA